VQLEVPSLSDLELIRSIKRDLIRKRIEIDAIKSGKRKKKAMKVYAELLTTLKLGDAS
jgi:hypothetical protein